MNSRTSGRVYVGEPVRLQVIVAGSVNPEEPTIGPINGAEIHPRGGSERRSSSVALPVLLNWLLERERQKHEQLREQQVRLRRRQPVEKDW